MQKTNIEWVKNPDGSQGFTSNPIKGYCPVACSYCYSRQDYDRFGWDKAIRFDTLEMDRLYSRQKPAGIFIGSMHELFLDEYIKAGWTERVINYARGCLQHRIFLLTKQPQNLIRFSPFPPNCWVGVTATNSKMFCDAIKELCSIEALKYISFEPLLKWGSFEGFDTTDLIDALRFGGINWVIIGAQTKPYKTPKPEWAREIADACKRARVPLFVKNNMERAMLTDEYKETTALLLKRADSQCFEIRQDMPRKK